MMQTHAGHAACSLQICDNKPLQLTWPGPISSPNPQVSTSQDISAAILRRNAMTIQFKSVICAIHCDGTSCSFINNLWNIRVLEEIECKRQQTDRHYRILHFFDYRQRWVGNDTRLLLIFAIALQKPYRLTGRFYACFNVTKGGLNLPNPSSQSISKITERHLWPVPE
jgi:hypothetical protein